MQSFEHQLVKAIQRKREAEGLSIRGLAAVVGVSFSTLARIERGDGLPDNNSKVRLLEWLGGDAEEAGLSFDNVAHVHFRAAKNVRSSTVQSLLRAADSLRRHASAAFQTGSDDRPPKASSDEPAVGLSKEDLEAAAEKFRGDLGVKSNEPLESLKIKVEGIDIFYLTRSRCISPQIVSKLGAEACDEWSAMSVPINSADDLWAVLLNDLHTKERQRVTILEEYWHILLGHKLTKIARIAEAYGRTYDKVEEHDAYYLASASLLPKKAIIRAVHEKKRSTEIAREFGTSPELADYRIKRLGLWRDHVGKKIEISNN